MSYTQTVGSTWSSGSDSVSGSGSYTNDQVENVDTAIAAATTNAPLLVAFTIGKLKVLVISSDVAVTVKTNSTSSPQDTIAILAGKPLVWTNDSYFACPISGSVTEVYVTNAGGVVANFKMRLLLAL